MAVYYNDLSRPRDADALVLGAVVEDHADPVGAIALTRQTRDLLLNRSRKDPVVRTRDATDSASESVTGDDCHLVAPKA
jgi:hypothetical protein